MQQLIYYFQSKLKNLVQLWWHWIGINWHLTVGKKHDAKYIWCQKFLILTNPNYQFKKDWCINRVTKVLCANLSMKYVVILEIRKTSVRTGHNKPWRAQQKLFAILSKKAIANCDDIPPRAWRLSLLFNIPHEYLKFWNYKVNIIGMKCSHENATLTNKIHISKVCLKYQSQVRILAPDHK